MFLLINTGWLDEVMWVVQGCLDELCQTQQATREQCCAQYEGVALKTKTARQLGIRKALEKLCAAWPESVKEMRKLKQKAG